MKLAIAVGACLLALTAYGQTSDTEKLRAINETAREICTGPTNEGTSTSMQIGGEVSAAVLKLSKKFGIDVSAEGKGTHHAYSGVPQAELAGLVRGTQQCRQQVFEVLVDRLLPRKAISPTSRVSRGSSTGQESPGTGPSSTAPHWRTPKLSAADFANRWIALLDADRFEEAYNLLHADQRNAWSLAQYSAEVDSVRKRMHGLKQRTLIGAGPLPKQASGPEEMKTFLVSWRTEWNAASLVAGATPGDEFVTLVLDREGRWQVDRYMCLNCEPRR